MKRKLLAVLFTGVLSAAMIAGCGEDTSSDNTETVQETQDAQEEEEEEEETETPADGEEDVASEEEAEAAGFSDGTEEADTEEDSQQDSQQDTAEGVTLDVSSPLEGTHHAEIVIKDYGTIELELDADTAPLTVTNFVKLAQEGFYDGLTFHRIIDGFMMQGGDPNGDGTGGSDENVKGEFSSNGVENDISHVRGVISMARATDPDSGSSQFFIVQSDSEFLDGDYAAFGKVTEGMDIVDEICASAQPTDNNGSIPSDEQPVIEKLIILD